MRRFFITRRLFLSGKNKITIFSPCSTCSTIIYSGLYKIALLCLLCLLFKLCLQQRNVAQNQQQQRQPPAIRIFCIISTYAPRHSSTAVHVKRTWSKHCDHFLFVSDDSHEELEPAVFPNLSDKWQQLRAHLYYVYKYHFDQGDWFLYANDNNFVIVENLRNLLQPYNSEDLVYFGCKLRSTTNQTYMYDRSGMAFSRATLRKFVQEALPNEDICSSEPMGNAATVELGRCLSNILVLAGDSRDQLGYQRFLPFELKQHLSGRLNASLEVYKNFIDRSYYKVSNHSVPASKSYISSNIEYMPNIYNLYYLIYKVKIFGLPRVSEMHESNGNLYD